MLRNETQTRNPGSTSARDVVRDECTMPDPPSVLHGSSLAEAGRAASFVSVGSTGFIPGVNRKSHFCGGHVSTTSGGVCYRLLSTTASSSFARASQALLGLCAQGVRAGC